MELRWAKTDGAWFAALPHLEPRGTPIPQEEVPPEVISLATTLLREGGECVVVWFDEPPEQSKAITENGQKLEASDTIAVQGRRSQCHTNCAKLWMRNKKLYRIVTGYALTASDQIWRGHTWLLDSKNRIMETTVARSVYFGITLDADAAKLFAEMVL